MNKESEFFKSTSCARDILENGLTVTVTATPKGTGVEAEVKTNRKNGVGAVILLAHALNTLVGGKTEDIFAAAFDPDPEQFFKLIMETPQWFNKDGFLAGPFAEDNEEMVEDQANDEPDKKMEPFSVEEEPGALVISINRDAFTEKDVSPVLKEIWDVLHG